MKDFIISLVLRVTILINAMFAANMLSRDEIIAGVLFAFISLVMIDIYVEYKKS